LPSNTPIATPALHEATTPEAKAPQTIFPTQLMIVQYCSTGVNNRGREWLSPQLATYLAKIDHALADIGNIILPIRLVLNADDPDEALAIQFG